MNLPLKNSNYLPADMMVTHYWI